MVKVLPRVAPNLFSVRGGTLFSSGNKLGFGGGRSGGIFPQIRAPKFGQGGGNDQGDYGHELDQNVHGRPRSVLGRISHRMPGYGSLVGVGALEIGYPV